MHGAVLMIQKGGETVECGGAGRVSTVVSAIVKVGVMREPCGSLMEHGRLRDGSGGGLGRLAVRDEGGCGVVGVRGIEWNGGGGRGGGR